MGRESAPSPSEAAPFDEVSSTSITLDMPQVSALGSIPVRVDDGALNATSSITVVAPPDPVLQIGNGEIASLNIIPSGNGLDVIYAGLPGEFHFVLGSTSNVPSTIPIVSLCLGNGFTDLFEVASGTRTVWKRLTPSDPVGVEDMRETLVITPDAQSYCYSYLRRLGDLFVVDRLK